MKDFSSSLLAKQHLLDYWKKKKVCLGFEDKSMTVVQVQEYVMRGSQHYFQRPKAALL
jgi:hypothetical protein